MYRLAFAALAFAIATLAASSHAASSFGQIIPVSEAATPGYNCDREIAVGPDESVYATLFSTSGTGGWAIARFDAAGSLDTSWARNAVASIDAPASLLPLPDGRLIAASNGKLKRFTAQGAIDATFGDAGTSDSVTGGNSGYINSMAVQPDGSILVLGIANNDSYTVAPASLAMTRILPNGRRDSTFGVGGFIYVSVPDGAKVYAWSVMSDGVLELGYMSPGATGAARPEVRRYPSQYMAPALDRVMPHAGIASWTAPAVGTDGFGRALFATEYDPYGSISPEIVLTRFMPDGSLDTSFGTGGRAGIAVQGHFASDPAQAVSKMLWEGPDGSWTVLADIDQGMSGWAMIDVYHSTLAVRFRVDGSADPQFAQGTDLGGWQLTKFAQLRTGELLHLNSGATGCGLVKQANDVVRADAVMVEYYHPALDHYFMTLEGAESKFLDAHVDTWGWQRTGRTFAAWLPVNVPGTTPLCRFYGDPVIGPNSHFYTPQGPECDFLRSLEASAPPGQPAWHLEGFASDVTLPTDGQCPANLSPVYRVYNDGFGHGRDPNHRYTTDPALYAQMQSQGWVPEGVRFCVPLAASRSSTY